MAHFSTVTTSRGAGAPRGTFRDDSANISTGALVTGRSRKARTGRAPSSGRPSPFCPLSNAGASDGNDFEQPGRDLKQQEGCRRIAERWAGRDRSRGCRQRRKRRRAGGFEAAGRDPVDTLRGGGGEPRHPVRFRRGADGRHHAVGRAGPRLLLGGANRLLVILALIPAAAMGFTLLDRSQSGRTPVKRG